MFAWLWDGLRIIDGSHKKLLIALDKVWKQMLYFAVYSGDGFGQWAEIHINVSSVVEF